jgi:hypothetical protein
MVLIPGKGRKFCLPHPAQSGSDAHPRSADIKDMRVYTSTSPHAFMGWKIIQNYLQGEDRVFCMFMSGIAERKIAIKAELKIKSFDCVSSFRYVGTTVSSYIHGELRAT